MDKREEDNYLPEIMEEMIEETAHLFFGRLMDTELLRGGLDTIQFESNFSSCVIGRRRNTAEEEYDYYSCEVPRNEEEYAKTVKNLKLKIARRELKNVGNQILEQADPSEDN